VRLLLICLAGAGGTGARYLIGVAAARWLGPEFPYGTLVVNVLGSFAIGLVQQSVTPEGLRLILTVGLLGGFTTYSAFSYETLKLMESGVWLVAALNVVATTALCLVGCGVGLELGRALLVGRAGG